jgi:NAD(P)-dependent dehydrogenase (short-subunit alcohol dehydrogenase family)
MASWSTSDIPDQSRKLAIVTGATGGLGTDTALGLAGAGAEVILAGRNPAKGQAGEALIRDRNPDAKVRFELVDLASLTLVVTFADRVLAAGRPVDILINNAGVMAPRERATTADGFEMQFGTNYLSHFTLTARLLPLLTAARARVVQLSSVAHRSGKIRPDDLNHSQGYKPFPVYSQSKLAMLMFAIELDPPEQGGGQGPEQRRGASRRGAHRVDRQRTGRWSQLAGASCYSHRDGADRPVLHCWRAAGADGGDHAGRCRRQYFGPRGWNEFKGPPGRAKIKPQALDPTVAAELWDASEKLTGVALQ